MLSNCYRNIELTLTARQYGEVVLPEATPVRAPVLKLENCHGARKVRRVFLQSSYKHYLKAGSVVDVLFIYKMQVVVKMHNRRHCCSVEVEA
jgi:hypothetical protein